MKKIASVLLLSTALMGCSEATIDTTTEESMQSSIEKVRKSLSEDDKDKFDEALKIVAFSQVEFSDLFLDAQSNSDVAKSKMEDSLNGKTASEVMDEAKIIEKERKEREKQQALNEIKELEQKKEASEKASLELNNFEVVRSRFYKREGRFSTQPIIELTVSNKTNEAVSRVFFKGTLSSPNRSVPWLEETFNYQIAGGLEPGETAEWVLAPNMFSKWGSVESPEDTILTVEVERLDDAEGNEMFSTRGFSRRDADRLRMLKEEFGS